MAYTENRRPVALTDAMVRKCRIYDVFEKDPAKKLIAVFDTAGQAADFLGLRATRVSSIINNKSRNSKNKLKRTITIR